MPARRSTVELASPCAVSLDLNLHPAQTCQISRLSHRPTLRSMPSKLSLPVINITPYLPSDSQPDQDGELRASLIRAFSELPELSERS